MLGTDGQSRPERSFRIHALQAFKVRYGDLFEAFCLVIDVLGSFSQDSIPDNCVFYFNIIALDIAINSLKGLLALLVKAP